MDLENVNRCDLVLCLEHVHKLSIYIYNSITSLQDKKYLYSNQRPKNTCVTPLSIARINVPMTWAWAKDIHFVIILHARHMLVHFTNMLSKCEFAFPICPLYAKTPCQHAIKCNSSIPTCSSYSTHFSLTKMLIASTIPSNISDSCNSIL